MRDAGRNVIEAEFESNEVVGSDTEKARDGQKRRIFQNFIKNTDVFKQKASDNLANKMQENHDVMSKRCTFKPQISENSKKLQSNRHSIFSYEASEQYEDKRKANLEKIKAQMAIQTPFRPNTKEKCKAKIPS